MTDELEKWRARALAAEAELEARDDDTWTAREVAHDVALWKQWAKRHWDAMTEEQRAAARQRLNERRAKAGLAPIAWSTCESKGAP